MYNVSDFTEQFDRCLMNEPPFCSAACPFGFDARLFTERIKQNLLKAAYKQYRDAVVFPGIVSKICDRPCEGVCPLGPVDRPIDLIGLERFVTETAEAPAPDAYNLPLRGKRVAVIGGGLSGLACALKLAQKKYSVTIYSSAPVDFDSGAPLTGESPSEEFSNEIKYQFGNEVCDIKTRHINSKDEIMAGGFDAVYVATGAGGEAFGLSVSAHDAMPSLLAPKYAKANAAERSDAAVDDKGEPKPSSYAASRGGLSDLAAEAGVCWIAGGSLVGRHGVYAIADGAIAAAAIDGFLKTGILRTDRPARTSRMALDPLHLERYKAELNGRQTTSLGDLYTKGGGLSAMFSEAERCLGCRCDACMLYCDLPVYADKWPPRIRDEVIATTLPGKAEVKATPAKRLINTDNLSGVLAGICPAGIDMDALLLAGRQSMHRQGKMPWAFHEFWLRDMEHANGEKAAILINTRHKSPAKRTLAFFPGCQLGAAAPALVQAAFEELQGLDGEKKISLSGLTVRCCGAPAEWAGDEALFAEALSALRSDWETLGRPTLVCACPTCVRMLGKHMPEIDTVSLYEILPPVFSAGRDPGSSEMWAVFDPCAAAHLQNTENPKSEDKSAAVRKSVREHAAAMGLSVEPLPIQENVPRCCGFGGQPECADPAFVNAVRENRAAESGLPYICYCMNCREAFFKIGKSSAHILELRYANTTEAPELSPSRRRANRERLKASLVPALSSDERQGFHCDLNRGSTCVVIPNEVMAQMDADKIISEDVYTVIDHMRRTNESAYHPVTNVHSGSLVIGRTTYWVDYTEEGGRLTVTNTYAHRLAVEHEEVWAGATKEQRRQTVQDQNTGESGSTEGGAGLICERCDVEMKEMDAEFSYLDRFFRHKIKRCPACGLAYIPEHLARGRMREVEMSLEDK